VRALVSDETRAQFGVLCRRQKKTAEAVLGDYMARVVRLGRLE